ncbi:MAG TPA: TonB-dependent receptor plug domain-containing protein [Candidatus Acidoferrales bacterium]|nr:TonB-dependent receptor plug domain-containing protein [Candidatus Acidoferrales bacterium]
MRSIEYPGKKLRLARRRAICALLLFLPLLFAGSVNAATAEPTQKAGDISNNLKTLSLAQLGNVNVTSVSKEPIPMQRTPAAIYVLTQDDIRRSGATSVPELLRTVPGVEVARIDSDHWSIGIRGFGSEFSKSVLVLIDGRSVYSPLFSGVYWNVQNVMLEDVQRIEVVRGPGGTIWGANAVDGVINIITKNSAETHGLVVSSGAGNVDQGTGAFRYGAGNGAGTNFRIYGMAFGRDAEIHPDHAPFDAWQMGQGGFRIDRDRGGRDRFTLQGDAYKGYNGERVTMALYSPPSTLTIDDAHDVSGANVLGRWRRQINGQSDIELQGYYDRTSRLSPQLNDIRNTLDIDFMYHRSLGARNDLLMGAGARWSADNITQKFATLNFTSGQETDSIYSGFLQDQITIAPGRVALTIGSKFEHNNRSGFDVQPSARALWTPARRQAFWAAVTRAVRTPSRLDQDLQLTELLLPSPPFYLRVTGSPSFKSEQMLGTGAGSRTLIAGNLYLDAALFYNNYDDLYGYGPATTSVETSPAPTHIVLQLPLANATKGDTAGFEIAPDWKPFDWWELKGSYSYLHLHVGDKPRSTGTYNSLVTLSDNGSSPHHQIEAQSLFELPRKVEVDMTYRFVSALPAQTSTPPGATVNGYSTGDFRVGWQPNGRIGISFVGQNLFQPQHAEFSGDDGPLVGIRRSYYGKITCTLE